MPGKAIVAATDEMLMMLPPLAGDAVGPHRPQAPLEAERGAEDVDLEHRADVLRVDVDDQAADLDPGVVDQHVQPAEVGGGRRDRVLPAALVGHVEVHEPVAVALQRVGDLRAEVVLEVGDDDPGAGRGQGLRHAFAEALGASGDEGRAAGEVESGHGVLLGATCGSGGRHNVGRSP